MSSSRTGPTSRTQAEPVRVALVCPYSLSVPGGVQGQVLGLRRALVAGGCDAVVVAPCDGPAPDDGVAVVGATIAVPANGSRAPVALGPRTLARAARILRRGGFDVVHLHEPFAPGPAWAALTTCTVPIAGTFHRSGASRGYVAAGWVLRRMARRLAWQGAVSDEARATARAVLGPAARAIEIIPNGIDLARFAAAEPFPSGARPAILFVGRHETRKGLGVLLEAYRRIATAPSATTASAPAPVLWVVGDGPEGARLRAAYTDEGIAWMGRVTDAELTRLLKGASVVAAPALGGESFGIVLIEAMAAGTPVVASDIPGYRALAGDHAALVPPGDAPALAAALAKALDASPDGAGPGSVAHRRSASAFAHTFSMETVAARYREVYERIAGRKVSAG